MAVTFDVSPHVELGQPLPPIDVRLALASSLQGRIEAAWKPATPLVAHTEEHALLEAVQLAFFQHYPLEISPDAVWLTLARGFALHVNLHAEELRERFVRHQGKEKLVVNRPDFLLGRDNPWPEAFAAFSEQMAARVGKLRDFIVCDFSTTGLVERAASELMVMDTFQAYFEYEMYAGCGIPRVTLTGTVDDWKSIRRRAGLFAEFGLDSWCQALEPVLDQFVQAAEGRADEAFWQSMFRYHSGSAGTALTGWIVTFFPYLKDFQGDSLKPNPYSADWRQRLLTDAQQRSRHESLMQPQGPGMRAIPPCLTSVPLKVYWGEAECEMRLVGGLIGVSQCPETLALRAEAGWIVMQPEQL